MKSQERPNRGSRLFVHKNTFQSSNQPNELKSQRPYWNKVQSTKHRKAKVLSKNKAAQLDLQLELYPDFLRHLVAAAASSLMEAFEEHNALRFVSQLKRLASKTPILAATEFSKHLLVWMEEMADKVGTTELPDWIWSLGKLGYSYQDYKFRLIVNKALTKFCSASNLSGKDITTTLGGLHRAGVTWKNLPDSLRLSLLKIISDGSLLFNSREISNTLYAVQRMGIPWTEFDMDQRKQIRRSIVAQKNNMNDQEASNTVYSLGLLGEDYSQLTTEEVDAVFTIVKSGMMATKNPPRNVCQQVKSSSIFTYNPRPLY
ncbi:hypothetical protein EON65_03340 [archaeon]|nr:MAG: hypothetical protein EON65_03340 [archaeon]